MSWKYTPRYSVCAFIVHVRFKIALRNFLVNERLKVWYAGVTAHVDYWLETWSCHSHAFANVPSAHAHHPILQKILRRLSGKYNLHEVPIRLIHLRKVQHQLQVEILQSTTLVSSVFQEKAWSMRLQEKAEWMRRECRQLSSGDMPRKIQKGHLLFWGIPIGYGLLMAAKKSTM